MSGDFWLVQRVRDQRWPGNAKGFDREFALEYMGAAEFEWGAIPASLKRIRAERRLIVHPFSFEYSGTEHSVFFVGAKKRMPGIEADFDAWAHDAQPFRTKEPTGLGAKLVPYEDYRRDTIAWWALNEDMMFTLDETVANRLLAAIAVRVDV